jgi:hypothetical protein
MRSFIALEHVLRTIIAVVAIGKLFNVTQVEDVVYITKTLGFYAMNMVRSNLLNAIVLLQQQRRTS